MKQIHLLLVTLMVLIAGCGINTEESTGSAFIEEPAQYVNPFIGTDGHGHTYPGASMPFGMVQLSPDTRLEGWDGCSGYHYSDSIVYGFSHTALSGTGVPDYNDILFMPAIGEVYLDNGSADVDRGYASRFSHSRETAEAGYYKTHLSDYGMDVELTTSKRVGFHKYTQEEGEPFHVIVDLDHRDKVVDSWLRVVSETEIEGFRRSTAWANDQYLYFVARFSAPFSRAELALDDGFIESDSIGGEQVKGVFHFDQGEETPLMVKVGISAVDAAGARKNLETEIPHWDFDKQRKEAHLSWNAELNKIQIAGGTDAQKITFYSALYHAYLVPNLFQDVDGRYRGRDLEIHQEKDFEYYTVFSLWDTFRGEHPLFTLTQQQRTVDFIRTMIAQYEQGGRLPVWELAANETECMIGYHAVPVIVDAYMKGIRDFDAGKAFEAMAHSAQLNHFGLEFYKEQGYIPAHEESESVSKTLEYAYDDWCIAIMAKELGRDDDYRKYLERAQSYKNVFDPGSGFMRAKMNGRWFEPFDAREVNFNYTEANSWQYSFFVPQDISGLVSLLGGKDAMIGKLDEMFDEPTETTGRHQSDITGLVGQYAHGNEPSHHMAYLYNYLGQPWKTQERTRQIMNELYSPLPDGLCGNEDCGQMSAWYVLSAMGIYSVTPGDESYVIGSPLFDAAKLKLENGKSFTIRTTNNSKDNLYIQTASLNGKPLTKNYITHSEILAGGDLLLEMGPGPNKSWGVGEGSLPVSEIKEHLITPVPFVLSGERTFVEDTEVALGCISKEAAIYYTLDGNDPGPNTSLYSGPFKLSKSAELKAIVIPTEGNPSKILTASFHKIPVGRTITLSTSYANQYSGGGNLCLIDFIRGPLNYRTGAWQGYEGVDIDAVVDLGSIQLVSKLETGFLQDVGAWIFMPLAVSYYVSMDGNEFQHIGTIENKVSHRRLGVNIQDFTLNHATKARYIRMVAKNQGNCPPWHVGEGNPAWIFADEIVIE